MKRNLVLIVSLICVLALLVQTLAACGSGTSEKHPNNNNSNNNNNNNQSLDRYEINVFDEDGSQYDYQVLYVSTDNQLRVPEKRNGAVFIGFYTTGDNICYFDENGNQIPGLMITKNLDLYLKFEPQSCTIKFDLNGGTLEQGDAGNYRIMYGDTVNISFPVVEKEGYTFVGWETSSGRLISEGDWLLDQYRVFDSNYDINEDNVAILKARYEEYVPQITLDYNDGTGKTETRKISYGETIGDLPTLDDGSSMLVGWAYSPYARSNEVIDPLSVKATEDVTLYAVYCEYRTAMLVYTDENIKTVRVFSDSPLKLPTGEEAADENPGFNIVSWYKDANFTGGTSVAYLYFNDNTDAVFADWTEAVYTIVFLNDDGTPYMSGSFDREYDIDSAFPLPVPEAREHYTFLGWCRSADLSDQPVTELVQGSYKSAQMRQKWLPDQTSIELYVRGAWTGNTSVGYNEKISFGVPQLDASEEFSYWYMMNGETEIKLTDENGELLAPWTYTETSVTVYARISAKKSLTLTYADPADSSNTIVVDMGTKVSGEKVPLTKPDALSKYEIRAWVVNGEEKSTSQSFVLTMPDVDTKVEIRYSLPAADFTVKGNLVYKYGNHFYSIIDNYSVDFGTARALCKSLGGHLVTFSNMEEINAVLMMESFDSAVGNYWIGAYRDGDWKWVTNEPFSFTNWDPGEPSGNADMAYMYESGLWDDASGSRGFICEWDSPNAAKVQNKTLKNSGGEDAAMEIYSYNGHFYAFFNEEKTWEDAEGYAEQIGGHLVTITSAEENEFVNNTRKFTIGNYRVFIGATDYANEGTWIWVTGEAFNYTNWSNNEPDNSGNNEHFAELNESNLWNDVPGTTQFRYVVEWEKATDIGVKKYTFINGEISSASEMQKLRNSFPKSEFILRNDIDMSGMDWTPVNFSGTLDGAGHKIKNLTINASNGDLALFNKMSGTVKDLVFENVNIKSTSYTLVRVATVAVEMTGTVSNVKILSGSIGGEMTESGGIAATVTGRIENSENRASIGGGTSVTDGIAGGIAARVQNPAVLDYCTNYGKISGYRYLGGIASIVGSNVTISNCTNNGEVTGKERIGGLISTIDGSPTLASLTNNGQVTATSDYCGGIVSYASFGGGVIYDTVFSNTAAITGTNYTGGIIGYCKSYTYWASWSWESTTFTISKFSNSGTIKGSEYTGGVFGYLDVWAQSKNGTCTNALTATDITNAANITGKSFVGGIAGYAHTTSTVSKFSECSSSGEINGEYYIGGLAGKLESIIIDSCSNTNTRINATGYLVDGTVYHAYIGGYVGYGYAVENCINDISITYSNRGNCVGGIAGYLNNVANNCQNNGTISAVKSEYVGGIAGYSDVSGGITMAYLTNTAAITGTNYTGGIFGYCKSYTYWASWSWESTTFTISKFSNSGTIKGSNYSSGIIGYLSVTAQSKNGTCANILTATDISNSARVSGMSYLGGIFGSVNTTSTSSVLTDPISTGKCSGTGDHIGKYIGEATNITIEE